MWVRLPSGELFDGGEVTSQITTCGGVRSGSGCAGGCGYPLDFAGVISGEGGAVRRFWTRGTAGVLWGCDPGGIYGAGGAGAALRSYRYKFLSGKRLVERQAVWLGFIAGCKKQVAFTRIKRMEVQAGAEGGTALVITFRDDWTWMICEGSPKRLQRVGGAGPLDWVATKGLVTWG